MGICGSSHITFTSKCGSLNWASTAKVIGLDGRLQEFRQPITASDIISHNPNCFLCSSETIFVDAHAPHVPCQEELQHKQIYFLMPLSKSQTPLSLQDLCALAIKASTALANAHNIRTKTMPFFDENSVSDIWVELELKPQPLKREKILRKS